MTSYLPFTDTQSDTVNTPQPDVSLRTIRTVQAILSIRFGVIYSQSNYDDPDLESQEVKCVNKDHVKHRPITNKRIHTIVTARGYTGAMYNIQCALFQARRRRNW